MNMDISTLIMVLAIGLFSGVVAGMVGVGGGIVIIPALVFFLGFSQGTAQGTSLAMMLPPIGVLAAINYAKAGMVDWKVAMIMAAAFIIGGWAGSKLAITLPEMAMKRIFAVLLVVAAVRMAFWK